ncbi:MAG: NlpC/P60 family protein [Lachnospiraceae bacterium]|nr:NlpC/P60 family protein [Lachnospiraceae bacterium]
MATKTNSGLVAYAKAQIGLPYWFGCYGQIATAALYKTMKAQYPSYYTASDFSSQYGKRVHDCSGIPKGYLWSDSATAVPKYKAAQDLSAAGMYAAAKTKGAISTFPKTAGLLVFRGSTAAKISHVGVYGGDGYVYEAKGHAYGVVKSAYSASNWNFWGQHPDITDDTSSSGSTSSSSVSSASSSTSSSKTVTATEAARSGKDSSLAGTYKVANCSQLNVRNGAGTKANSYGSDKSILVTIPVGTSVQCYGYYTTVSGTKWLYIQFTYNNVTYIGFASSTYLAKQ